MRPILKKYTIALFTPQGFLDGNNASALITLQDMQATIATNASMVLISLKKVVFFNKNGISVLLDILYKLHKQMKAVVGFCDYDKKQYDAFFKFFDGQVSFALFKTVDIAMLFSARDESEKSNKNVLIFNEDATQKSMQAIEIFDHGYNPVIMQTLDEFLKRAQEKENFLYIVNMTYLGLTGNKVAAKTRGNTVIYYLKGFLDGSIVEQFDIAYHQNCLKVGFQLFMFDATRVNSLNIHAANFFAKLSTAGAEYGALIAIVGLEKDKTPQKFTEELEDAGILFFDNQDDFFTDETVKSMSNGAAAMKKKGHKLTKSMVSKLPKFIDATVETLQMMTNMMAIKEDMKICPFSPGGDTLMAGSIAFYGDIEGMVTLAMPKKLVKKSCALLLGEESEDEEALADTLGELINIIAGKSKSGLQEIGIRINITLPRSYASIEDLKAVLKGVEGIQVNFSFEDYPFTFYLNP